MKYRESTLKEEDILVDSLLSLPVKNLEQRIAQLEKEINDRQELSDKILCDLRTSQFRLEDKIQRLSYLSVFSPGFRVRQELESQWLKLEAHRQNEILSCFTDLATFREKLQIAKEQHAKNRLKLNIIDTA